MDCEYDDGQEDYAAAFHRFESGDRPQPGGTASFIAKLRRIGFLRKRHQNDVGILLSRTRKIFSPSSSTLTPDAPSCHSEAATQSGGEIQPGSHRKRSSEAPKVTLEINIEFAQETWHDYKSHSRLSRQRGAVLGSTVPRQLYCWPPITRAPRLAIAACHRFPNEE